MANVPLSNVTNTAAVSIVSANASNVYIGSGPGNDTGFSNAGAITIEAGYGGLEGGFGGGVSIKAGTAQTGNASGGDVSIRAGYGEGTGDGGAILLQTNTGEGSGAGGPILLTTADGGTNNHGGDLTFTLGFGNGSGRNGLLIIAGAGLPTADPLVAGALWNNAGTLKISAG